VGDTRITWRETTEPFTGLNYWWTYKIDGPQGQALDLEWGNLLPVYGTYKYAQFTGDWAFVQARWSRIREVMRFTDYADDWAWMTNSNGDMGYSTGTGDPMTAAFGGHVAALKMARALGDTDAETSFAGDGSRRVTLVVHRLGAGRGLHICHGTGHRFLGAQHLHHGPDERGVERPVERHEPSVWQRHDA